MSDRRATETAQSAIRRRLEHAIESVGAVVYAGDVSATASLDAGVPATFVSETVRELFGYEPADCLHNPDWWMDHVHPDDRAGVRRTMERLAVRNSVEHEYRVRRADGAYVWIRDYVRLVRDDAGRPRELVGVWYDVSDEIAVRSVMREREANHRSLFDTVPDAILVFDATDHHFVDVNEAACAMYGYTRADFLRLSLWEVTAEPEDTRRTLEETTPQSPMRILHRFHRRKDGSRFPVEVMGSVLRFGGRKAYCGIVRDVSENERIKERLRASEERLRRLAERQERVREDELRSVARRVHDEIGQLLTAVKLELRQIQTDMADESHELRTRLVGAIANLDVGVEVARRICRQLRPGVLEELGLVMALETELDEFVVRAGMQGEASLPPLRHEPSREAATALFRCFQELLTNVARHAEASLLRVALWEESEGTFLDVEDDGVGITVAQTESPSALGITGVRERMHSLGGTVQFSRGLLGGARVRLFLPTE